MFVFDSDSFCNPRYIINFPTKLDWKHKSRMQDIESGLVALVQVVRERNIRSIAIPPLGCGLGGLKWEEVRPRIEAALAGLPDVQVFLYEPSGPPDAAKIVKNRKAPNMTVGRAALIGLMRRYLSAVMDPTVTLFEVHKLMYFMQEAGQPLRLQYNKAPYGPYAKNLGHVLHYMEGHFISGYLDGGDSPDKPIELKADAVSLAEEFLESHEETRQRFDRVTDLIQGFETPYGMELLSTVHWVAKHEGARQSDAVVTKVYEWNERKKMFPVNHILIALDVLQQKNWLDVSTTLSTA
jgi:O-acetyl-ADP-ribose deacetylase (regulator of RNase III)